jgi:hypothetical protein
MCRQVVLENLDLTHKNFVVLRREGWKRRTLGTGR